VKQITAGTREPVLPSSPDYRKVQPPATADHNIMRKEEKSRKKARFAGLLALSATLATILNSPVVHGKSWSVE
jgi:hypothetical protein